MVKSSEVLQKSCKGLCNSLKNTHTQIVHPVKRFVLKSSIEFSTRSLSIFNKLKPIETHHDAWMSENETIDSFDLNNNVSPPVAPPIAPIAAVVSDVFKKPTVIPRKRKGNFTPYNRSTKKWIKYSLEDVQLSSDATNAAIAMQFLDEQRKKKEQSIKEENLSDDKIMFRKPTKRPMNVNTLADSASSSNDKVFKQCEKIQPNKSNSEIKLLHLEGDFDNL